ncbi:MAG: M24 family metallopeptidase, partial [Nitriliruptoraceae bacterium]
AGVEAVVDGDAIGAVDEAARSVVQSAGFGDYFVHPTGHGVGLQIHEQPTVAKGAHATIRPGLVFTVEPGVYVPGVGGVRIEDTVVIGSDGDVEVLTASSRALRTVR